MLQFEVSIHQGFQSLSITQDGQFLRTLSLIDDFRISRIILDCKGTSCGNSYSSNVEDDFIRN